MLNINCIYGAQEYIGKTKKEKKATCKKSRIMATIKKPISIDFDILMFSDRDLEDVYSFHDDALVIKV